MGKWATYRHRGGVTVPPPEPEPGPVLDTDWTLNVPDIGEIVLTNTSNGGSLPRPIFAQWRIDGSSDPWSGFPDEPIEAGAFSNQESLPPGTYEVQAAWARTNVDPTPVSLFTVARGIVVP